MNHTQITELLDRYWEGETTLVEERQLRDYFTSGKIDDRFRDVAPLFMALHQEVLQVKAPQHLGAAIEPAPLRVTGFNVWKKYMAAAVLTGVIAIGGWMYLNSSGHSERQQIAATPAPAMPAAETPEIQNQPVQQLAIVSTTPAKKTIFKRPRKNRDNQFSQEEALRAAEEIKAALALVSRKLNKGKVDAAKTLNKVEIVDQYFKQG